jgi:hypothetical protein
MKEILHVECKQEKRIMNIEVGIQTIVSSIEDLTNKLDDALFPSVMHPENGLINGYHNNKKNINEINEKIKKFEDANIITDLVTVKTEITKAKIWISAIIGISLFLYAIIDVVIKLFVS